MLLGILSRKINFIPLFIGDILYAILIYFGFCFLFPIKNRKQILLFSVLFCFSIEISQLLDLNCLNEIRSTTLGRYILGQGFLWTDLLCYTIGTILAYHFDLKLIKK